MILKKPIDQTLVNVVNKHKHGVVVLTELPSENYFGYIGASIKKLVAEGYGGIYISSQRPYSNMKKLFTEFKISMDHLLFIDAASSAAGDKQDNEVIHIGEQMDVNQLMRAIYTSLPQIATKQKFIFIDSVSTVLMHKRLSEMLRLAEFLIRETQTPSDEDNSVFLLVNIADNVDNKEFIQHTVLRAQEVVR